MKMTVVSILLLAGGAAADELLIPAKRDYKGPWKITEEFDRFDKTTILASIDKTSRALIVHEDVKTLGIGAELSATIMEERFHALDAPVMRLTYPDTHCPFASVLEQANLPNADKIAQALRTLAAY